MALLQRATVALAAVAAALVCAGPGAASTLFLIEGGGYGHGVGLGQWGAEGYALHGWTDTQILAHYYPHTTLATEPPQTLRILLAQRPHLTLSSARPFLFVDAAGTRIHVKRRAQLGADLVLHAQQLVPPVQVEAGAAVLSVDGKPYRGTLTLVRRGDTLSVVNNVSLEQYIRDVVPSEMPKLWLPAAYEAQAIAARSYALASMRGTGYFDLYGDTRDQAYDGVAAEEKATNAAVAATAGRVLTYNGVPIHAFYSASTGGRTEAVEAAFRGEQPEPYLVSVADPYDTISPHHRWRVRLDPAAVAHMVGFTPTDLHVQHDGAGHATEVEIVGAQDTKTVTGPAFAQTLGLLSPRFSIGALSLDNSSARVEFGQPLALQGFVRDLGGVSLQQRQPARGWRFAARVHAGPDGRFVVHLHPAMSAVYRLAAGHVVGPSIAVAVTPLLSLQAAGNIVSGTIRPSVPIRVERQTGGVWHLIAQLPVGPSGQFRTRLGVGLYRLASAASPQLAATTSASVQIVN